MTLRFSTGDSMATPERALVELAVRRLLDRLEEAPPDGLTFVNCFTSDAAYMTGDGVSCHGRPAIGRYKSDHALSMRALATTATPRSIRIAQSGQRMRKGRGNPLSSA